MPPETSEDPVLLRAALILIDGVDAEEQLTGTIATPIEDSSFVLTTAGGDIKVVLADGATIQVVKADLEQSGGSMADVQAGRSADAYGELATDGSFLATRVVVETGE